MSNRITLWSAVRWKPKLHAASQCGVSFEVHCSVLSYCVFSCSYLYILSLMLIHTYIHISLVNIYFFNMTICLLLALLLKVNIHEWQQCKNNKLREVYTHTHTQCLFSRWVTSRTVTYAPHSYLQICISNDI